MPTAAPLQILIFRHPDDRDIAPYQKALLRAFQGGEEAGNYLATGDDLGIQLEIFPGVPVLDPAYALDAFSHTATVLFIDRGLLDKGGDQLWDWLAQCWTLTSTSNGRHAMLAVAMDERVGRLYTVKRPAFANHQLFQGSGRNAMPCEGPIGTQRKPTNLYRSCTANFDQVQSTSATSVRRSHPSSLRTHTPSLGAPVNGR